MWSNLAQLLLCFPGANPRAQGASRLPWEPCFSLKLKRGLEKAGCSRACCWAACMIHGMSWLACPTEGRCLLGAEAEAGVLLLLSAPQELGGCPGHRERSLSALKALGWCACEVLET